ncbi:FadR/GntR family transcriptional regulator [Amycolatopsis jejuensis]|uniref:FadR/GntR family transcriptional regulator n=1 Tax=Amycolatopsis jejuensis TaxID=330084 RepID=UPI00068D3797|nr:FCD domain-containing protein [Amycolatopsis jejuensis]
MSVPASHGNAPAKVVARWLIDYLQSGELHPGDRLPPERRLSEILGVHRAKVRDAINPLEVLGLLDRRVGDGTYFVSTTSDLLPETVAWGALLARHDIAQMLEMRRPVSVEIAGLAAERRSPEQLRRLREMCGTMSGAAGDPDRFARAGAAFHRQIAEASGNAMLAGTVVTLQTLLLTEIARAEDPGQAMADYALLVNAIAASDAVAAREAMEAHIERVAGNIRALDAGD